MGGQPARRSKQTFPPNSFDIEISDRQKIESLIWSIMRDHLVITIMAQQMFPRWIKGEILALRWYELSNSAWFYGNKFWFFHLFPFSRFTPKQVLSEKPQFLACVSPSCQPSNALERPHLMCLCLLYCSGGDWNSLCEMIFAVIKESHSVELTVLMESRNCSSSPNSETGLLTAAGGAQKHSYCQEGYVPWFNLQRHCLLNWLCRMRNRKIE